MKLLTRKLYSALSEEVWPPLYFGVLLFLASILLSTTGCATLPSNGVKDPIQQDLIERQPVQLTQPLELPAWPRGAVAMSDDTGAAHACFAAPQAREIVAFVETAKANQVIADALFDTATDLDAEAQQLSELTNELNIAAEPEVLTLERLGWLAVIFALVVP